MPSNHRRIRFAATAWFGLSLWLGLCRVVSAGEAAAPTPDYHPSFGDLMTMAVQPRHIKLGIAGAAGNWAYAAYEVSELKNAFARIARTIPSYNGAAPGNGVGELRHRKASSDGSRQDGFRRSSSQRSSATQAGSSGLLQAAVTKGSWRLSERTRLKSPPPRGRPTEPGALEQGHRGTTLSCSPVRLHHEFFGRRQGPSRYHG